MDQPAEALTDARTGTIDGCTYDQYVKAMHSALPISFPKEALLRHQYAERPGKLQQYASLPADVMVQNLVARSPPKYRPHYHFATIMNTMHNMTKRFDAVEATTFNRFQLDAISVVAQRVEEFIEQYCRWLSECFNWQTYLPGLGNFPGDRPVSAD